MITRFFTSNKELPDGMTFANHGEYLTWLRGIQMTCKGGNLRKLLEREISATQDDRDKKFKKVCNKSPNAPKPVQREPAAYEPE